MIVAALALALSMGTAAQDVRQDPPQAAAPQTQAVELEDVVVVGRRLDELIDDFVDEVAEPARGRGLARWRNKVCVGVANMRPATAQAIADQVSRVALEIGLEPGDPGCNPNILVVGTTDANAFTRDFVANRPRLFRVGGSGMDAGSAAFRRFLDNDHPVRWWNVSVPVDADTGNRAVRVPGVDSCDTPTQCAPIVNVRGVSQLKTQIVDDMGRVFVILDMDKVSGVNTQQLGDYIAMIALAQIDPQANTLGYASILNLFEESADVGGLTQWDQAYLAGLYGSERVMANTASHRSEIADEVRRAHRRVRQSESQDATPNN